MLGSSERVLPPIPDPTMLTQNETLFEAYAACPPSARIYCTPEIRQSLFAEPSPMLATIWAFEVAAPRDGGRLR